MPSQFKAGPGLVQIRPLFIEEAVKNLETMKDRLQKNIVRQALRASLKVIAAPIKAGTYAGPRHRITGLLLRSQAISVVSKADVISAKLRMREVNVSGAGKLARLVQARRPNKTPQKTRAFYWWFLERGTAQRRTTSGASRGIGPRLEWVVPAFDQNSQAALDAFQQVLGKRVDEESANLPKGVTA